MHSRTGLIKYTALLLAVLFVAAGVPARADAAGDGVQYVRVLLSTEGQTSVKADVTGSYTLVEANRTFTGGTLTVKGDGNSVTVTHSKEGALYSGKTATIERVTLARSAGALAMRVVSGTRSFLGHFTFTANNSVVRVVNRVPLSHYLYGVVGYEMSNDFPMEALRAQAVAAKGYALLRASDSGSYDLGDTASDQVYKGYVASDTNVIAAVDSTISDVLYYNGAPLQCFYAASNGGFMIRPGVRWKDKSFDGAYASGEDIYDMANPFTPRETVFISSDYSSRAMGTRAFAFIDSRMTGAIIQSNAIPDDFHFAAVQSVDSVSSSGQGGYKGDLNHTDVTLKATVRTEIDPALIPTPTPAWPATPSPTPEWEPTPSPTPVLETPAPTEIPVAPAEGEEGYDPAWQPPTPTPPHELPTPTPAWPATPSPTPAWEPTPSPTPALELVRDVPVSFSFTFADMVQAGLYASESLKIFYAAPTANGFNLLHARYGHGVGMSQRGAQQMAFMGVNYRDILRYYYPGATIETKEFHSPENVPPAQTQTAATSASAGVVVGSTVNLREKAGTSEKSLEQLPVGTQLVLLGMDGDWYYVSAPSGSKGYVRYDYVSATGGGVIAQGVVNASGVNYRTGPGTDFDTLGKLSKNTQLGVYGMENGWYKVLTMTTQTVGYVRGDYVKLTKSTADAGTVAAPVTPTPTPLPAGVTPAPVVITMETPTPAVAPTVPPTITPVPVYAASGYINASRVNIRAGASTTTESYGKLERSTQLGLFEKTGAWYRVSVVGSGKTGYVYGKYVTLNTAESTPAPSGGAVTAATQAAANGAGYINASGVRLRNGASTAFNSIAKLSRNTTVRVLGSEGSWVKVEVRASDKQGYVFGKYVTMTGTTPSDTANGVITARLNLRTAPSTGAGSRVLTVMPRGAVVTVQSTANGWCLVNYNGTAGYCISACVRID